MSLGINLLPPVKSASFQAQVKPALWQEDGATPPASHNQACAEAPARIFDFAGREAQK
jgi:hypothetical protein